MEELDKKIQEAINSINNIQRASVPDYFETRLKARMENELTKAFTPWYFVKQPAWVITCLLFFIIANVYILMQSNSGIQNNKFQEANIENFASEYGLADE